MDLRIAITTAALLAVSLAGTAAAQNCGGAPVNGGANGGGMGGPNNGGGGMQIHQGHRERRTNEPGPTKKAETATDGGNGLSILDDIDSLPPLPDLPKDALQEQLDAEVARLKAEGKFPFQTKIAEANDRIAATRLRIDKLQDLIKQLEQTKDGTQELKDENENTSTRPTGSAAKTVGGFAAGQAGKWAAVRALGAEAGPVGLIASTIEQGLEVAVQTKFKNDTRENLDESLKGQAKNLAAMERVSNALIQDLGAEHTALKDLETEQANFRALEERWAEERLNGKSKDTGPATRNANIVRETDAEGDRDEARRASRERAMGGVKVVKP